MTEVRFYHLRHKPLDLALPELVSKAFAAGHRMVIRLPDKKQVEDWNQRLWTFQPDSFLPHGSARDGHPAEQPIWLTDTDENPNDATMLVLVAGAGVDMAGDYALCCDMFDGNDEDAVKAARNRWNSFKTAGFSVTYWQQTERGGWEQKA